MLPPLAPAGSHTRPLLLSPLRRNSGTAQTSGLSGWASGAAGSFTSATSGGSLVLQRRGSLQGELMAAAAGMALLHDDGPAGVRRAASAGTGGCGTSAAAAECWCHAWHHAVHIPIHSCINHSPSDSKLPCCPPAELPEQGSELEPLQALRSGRPARLSLGPAASSELELVDHVSLRLGSGLGAGGWGRGGYRP